MEFPNCPKCQGGNTYPFEDNYICPDCFHEWSLHDPIETSESSELVVKDANGVVLQNGDTVITIKNLPVKGSSQFNQSGNES